MKIVDPAGLTRREMFGAMAAALLSVAAAPAADGESQRRVLVIGDSQAQGLAAGLQRQLQRDRSYRVLDRSKIGTGLAFQHYDWPAAVHGMVERERADIVIVMFGANDRPPVRMHGVVDPGLSAAFKQSYGARVRDIAETLHQTGVRAFWVGHPIVKDPAYAEDMSFLNGIYDSNATGAGLDFVSTWAMFKGPDGTFAAYGSNCTGETTRLRADDGIHMTADGYDLLAHDLVARIAAYPDPGAMRSITSSVAGRPADTAIR